MVSFHFTLGNPLTTVIGWIRFIVQWGTRSLPLSGPFYENYLSAKYDPHAIVDVQLVAVLNGPQLTSLLEHGKPLSGANMHGGFSFPEQMYERQSVMLFQILSSVRSHQGSPHLAQLLLRIDFNKQFSTFSQSAFRLSNIAQYTLLEIFKLFV